MEKLDDNSILTWGTYKGKKLINVPASYLLWCYREGKITQDVKQYVEENMEVLKQQLVRGQ